MPVGYVYDTDSQTVMDSDEEVQIAVHNVFKAFRSSGSAYGVVQYFMQKNLQFPKRAYGGAWAGKLVWGRLTHSRVLGILYNPAYAGAYVYGRYRDQKQVNPQGLFIHHTVRLPKDSGKSLFWTIILAILHGRCMRKTINNYKTTVPILRKVVQPGKALHCCKG